MFRFNLYRQFLFALISSFALASCAHHNQVAAPEASPTVQIPTVSRLESLFLLSDAESKSISPENLSGEKGMGSRVELEDGSAKIAAANLGKGWKVNPYIVVNPGETITMGAADGPGVVNHIWMTIGNTVEYRDTILRIYWDDEPTPSVESPVGDFFASGWGQGEEPLIGSGPIVVNSRSGFNSFWQMPFRSKFRITMENTGEKPFKLYYQIDYSMVDVPENAAYFHAQFRMANPVAFKEPYTIVDGIKGKGHYVGTYLGHAAFSTGWWGEGEIKFYIDGDTDYPTINGTGEEDYFLGSYGYLKRHENGIPYEGNYSGEYAGYYSTRKHTIEDYLTNVSERRYGQYRWHIVDPIRFSSDLRVTIQILGWEYEGTKNTRRYLPLQDHLASVAFWYQTEPHQPFLALPGPHELKLSAQKAVVPQRNRPELVELYNAYDSTADVVMLGDSITHMANWGELLPDLSILNRGISGDRTSDVLARLTAIRKVKADSIFLMIGINDLYRNVDLETIKHNIRKIVEELTAFETTRKVYLQSTLPCNTTLSAGCVPVLPMVVELDAYLGELAQEHERVQYLDLVGLLSDENRMLSSVYTYDGLHLNSAGYAIWVNEINRVLSARAE